MGSHKVNLGIVPLSIIIDSPCPWDLSKLSTHLSFGKVTIFQGLTSGLDTTSVRNILVSFGFITFCGELPWGAFGYFLIHFSPKSGI